MRGRGRSGKPDGVRPHIHTPARQNNSVSIAYIGTIGFAVRILARFMYPGPQRMNGFSTIIGNLWIVLPPLQPNHSKSPAGS